MHTPTYTSEIRNKTGIQIVRLMLTLYKTLCTEYRRSTTLVRIKLEINRHKKINVKIKK